jgi:O-antigen ligase
MSALAYGALWLFVFALPWENAVSVIPGVAIVTKVTGGLALAGALGVVLTSAQVRRWHVLHIAGLLFLVWAGARLVLMPAGERLPFKYTTFLQLFIVLLIIWEVARTRARQRGLLTAYVFGGYVAAVSTVMLYRSTGPGELKRFAAVESDPNNLAMTLALAIPMAWYLGMTYPSPLLRWACRLFLPIGLFAIGLTASRGGMLAATVALMIVPLTMMKLSPGKLIAALLLLTVTGAVAATYIPERAMERLATTGTEVEDLSLGGRFGIWKAGVKALAKRPIAGYGVGYWRNAVSPWLGPDPQVAHNSFLSVAVESGLVGLVLYLTMFVAVFLALMRLPSLDRRFSLVLLAALVVAMSPLSWENQKSVWFVLAALLGLAVSARFDLGQGARPAAVAMRPQVVRRPPGRAREGAVRYSRTPETDPPT